MPIHTRYAAPANFATVKTGPLLLSTAPNPAMPKIAWVIEPAETPAAAAIDARCPDAKARPVMRTKFGPGETSPARVRPATLKISCNIRRAYEGDISGEAEMWRAYDRPMAKSSLSALGSLIADETRAQLLCALMDGRAHTGGELARFVGVSASSASEHLAKLLDAGMVAVEPQGRHRYFRLANADVANLIEAAGAAPIQHGSPPRPVPSKLLYARTCYKHLAGDLAVQIYDQLERTGCIESVDANLQLTDAGQELLGSLGADLSPQKRSRQPVVRTCLDWTERKHHLAGRAADAMLTSMLDRGWVVRDQVARSVRVTNAGESELFAFFGLPTRGSQKN